MINSEPIDLDKIKTYNPFKSLEKCAMTTRCASGLG
jgi:hypothetical protein